MTAGVDRIAIPGTGRRRPAACLLALVLAASTRLLTAQSFDVRVAGDTLHVRGTGLGLIAGPVSDHLKDGRSVRVDFDLAILEKPRGLTITQSRHTFILSFDLWEQRYAVTRAGAAPRSISHLSARDAEAWCLENTTVPLASLGRLARDESFWIRVEYRVQDQLPPSSPEDDSRFGLQVLIDALSRRRQDAVLGRSWESGPFRVRNR